MPSTNRMLRILGLFSLERPVMTPEWLIEELAVSRASVYRDLGQLARAGMLERAGDRNYVLGPMVVELDRQIRLTDPLLEVAQELPTRLAEDTGGTILLCRFHGRKVMCLHQVNGRNPALSVSYERGRAMPLYRGATSKIILAYLPPVQLKQLWAAERQTLVAAGLPNDYVQLTKMLAALRQTGYCVTEGEVDPDAVGFAVVLRNDGHLLGSLSVVMPAAMLTAALRKSTLSRLQSAAGRIEGRLESQRERARAQTRAKACASGKTENS